MIATINAVTYCGATPVLVDSEPDYWQMDVQQAAEKITPRTKAIVPVHIYGHPVDMDPLMEAAQAHGVAVIEDAAEAHGGEYKGRRCGGLGDAATFSFYGNKIITTGEGGMVTTNNAEIAKLAWTLRDHAFSTERHFWHKFVGFNYRMTNLRPRSAWHRSSSWTSSSPPAVATPPSTPAACKTSRASPRRPKQSGPRTSTGCTASSSTKAYGMNRDQLRQALAEHGIETRTFFIPMHCQPVYWQMFKGQRYPVAERLCRDGFYLPSASSLTLEEIEYIAGVIREVCPNL